MKRLLSSVVLAGALAWLPALLAQPYLVSTLAGSPGASSSVDGTNTAATFTSPAAIAQQGGNVVFISDGNSIRRAGLSGTNWIVTSLAGSVLVHGPNDGTNTAARLDNPQGMTVGLGGAVYIADTLNNAVRKLAASGTNWVVTTVAGLPGRLNTGAIDGTNTTARFDHPYGIAADASGNLFVADTYNHTIRKLTLFGTNWAVTTIAGLAGSSGSGNGTGSDARFNNPSAIAAGSDGRLYVSDFGNNMIRSLTPSGTNWVVATLAGAPGPGGSSDGVGSLARFLQPVGIGVDDSQHVYVADSGNNLVRRINQGGVVTTIAGTPGLAGSADGIGNSVGFYAPTGLASDGGGAIFVVDSSNFTIRQGRLAPVLQASLSQSTCVLAWPTNLVGFVPESSTNLPATAWTAQPNGIVSSGEHWFQTNSVKPGRVFYRLHKTVP